MIAPGCWNKYAVHVKSVELIVSEASRKWIIGKIVDRIASGLLLAGFRVEISSTSSHSADVSVFFNYFDPIELPTNPGNKRFVFVTHVDDLYRLSKLRTLLKLEVIPIFMSVAHASELASSMGKNSFPKIRIGTDIAQKSPTFKIGIASRRYDDGRKNEKWLVDLAKDRKLDKCEIHIFGHGWQTVVRQLRKLGVVVFVYDDVEEAYPTYADMLQWMKSNLNLYIYLGFDEGALGALDAYLLDIPLLISNQGFHREFELPNDSFFSDQEDFQSKLVLLANRFHKKHEDWSWDVTVGEFIQIIDPALHETLGSTIPKNGFSKKFPISFGFLQTKFYLDVLVNTLKRAFVHWPKQFVQAVKRKYF